MEAVAVRRLQPWTKGRKLMVLKGSDGAALTECSLRGERKRGTNRPLLEPTACPNKQTSLRLAHVAPMVVTACRGG